MIDLQGEGTGYRLESLAALSESLSPKTGASFPKNVQLMLVTVYCHILILNSHKTGTRCAATEHESFDVLHLHLPKHQVVESFHYSYS